MSARSLARSLAEWLDYQQSIHPRGIDLTLARVAEVAARLDLLHPKYRVITVAGTNGKGSTVEYCSRMLTAAGHRCGAFTSPHLLRYNERIRIDGVEVTDAELLVAFEAIETARGDVTLTFFEINALAALFVFRAREVDAAILEVGLGGRLDAVNILDADVAVVASIGFDHKDWLGDTLEQIGREKAGIFRHDRPAVLADAAMTSSVAAEGDRVGADVLWNGRDYGFTIDARSGHWQLTTASRTWQDLPRPSLAGDVQYANAAASIVAVAQLPLAVSQQAIVTALTEAQLPGRFQRIAGEIEWILDVAHNEPAAKVLAAHLARQACEGKRYTVAAILGDKDIDAVARALAPVTDEWILCGIDDPRGLAPSALAARSSVFAGAREAKDIPAGIALARSLVKAGDRVVICGSFLAVAPALATLGL
ncbi:MAG: bifunctional tetrahydrofolate synthase/dihydrofolate synthase [Steroidobacteraceae bacterium]